MLKHKFHISRDGGLSQARLEQIKETIKDIIANAIALHYRQGGFEPDLMTVVNATNQYSAGAMSPPSTRPYDTKFKIWYGGGEDGINVGEIHIDADGMSGDIRLFLYNNTYSVPPSTQKSIVDQLEDRLSRS